MKAQRHSFWNNIVFHFRHVWIWKKSMFLCSVLFVTVGMLNIYLAVRLPALLVGLLERNAPVREMAARLAGRLGVSDCVYYIGLATGMQYSPQALVSEFGMLQMESRAFHNLRSCLELENETNRGKGVETKKWRTGCNPPGIVCEGVEFTYSGNESRTIRHLDLNIKSGEKLGIVDSNGAGKTTLVKLICGLYDCSAWSCLEKAGLSEKVKSLPQGLETYLVKSIYENALDLSGGETQKLVLARSLYKDAPVLVLDEPTAGLDPIAEAEVYANFSRLVGDKTAVYISHRLSSCRFCDEILVFDRGKVVQQGDHETLVADADGLYYKLWRAQAKYYR